MDLGKNFLSKAPKFPCFVEHTGTGNSEKKKKTFDNI